MAKKAKVPGKGNGKEAGATDPKEKVIRPALGGMLLPEGAVVQYIPREKLIPTEGGARVEAGPIASLKRSVKVNGILEPLIVRAVKGGKFEVVSGNRRLEVANELELGPLPCIVKDKVTDESLLAQVFVTNTVRANLKRTDKEYLAQALVEAIGADKARKVLGLSKVGMEKLLAPKEEAEEGEGTQSDEGVMEPVKPMIFLKDGAQVDLFLLGKLSETTQDSPVKEGPATIVGVLGEVEITGATEGPEGWVIKWQNTP